jgi:hypothetical protein
VAYSGVFRILLKNLHHFEQGLSEAVLRVPDKTPAPFSR